MMTSKAVGELVSSHPVRYVGEKVRCEVAVACQDHVSEDTALKLVASFTYQKTVRKEQSQRVDPIFLRACP